MVITIVQFPQRVRCLPLGVVRSSSPACMAP
jgi:hypothetical protein